MRYLPWIAAVAVAGLTAWFLVSGLSPSGSIGEPPVTEGAARGDTLAAVGDHVLYDTDLALIRAGEGAVESWKRDQLLACAAVDAGLENTAVSDFVARRAVQVYLRDQMVDSLLRSVDWPEESEIYLTMRQDPELYLVERHYYQLILADSSMADSILTRLGWGQNFQVTARNISIGQKAGIGGDLGFLIGAEMLAQGLPEEVARLNGLSPVIPSSMGWHIFKVDETRVLEDTSGAVESTGRLLYETRIDASLDSLLQATALRYSVEVEDI